MPRDPRTDPQPGDMMLLDGASGPVFRTLVRRIYGFAEYSSSVLGNVLLDMPEEDWGKTGRPLPGDGPVCVFRWRTSGQPEDGELVVAVVSRPEKKIRVTQVVSVVLGAFVAEECMIAENGKWLHFWSDVLRWVPARKVME